MDGFLGVLQSTLAKQTAAQPDSQPDAAQELADEPRASTGNAPGAGSFERMMEKKARLKLEEKMATMDKYERRRFQLERGIAAPLRAPEDRGGAGKVEAGADGDDQAGPEAAGRRHGAETSDRRPGVHQSGEAGTRDATQTPAARKRAAEDKIAAARERAKQRRMRS